MKTSRHISALPPRYEAATISARPAHGRLLPPIALFVLILWGPLFLLGTTAFPADVNNPYAGMSWEEIREDLTCPEQVVDYLRRCHIDYQAEKTGVFNHTQTPEETLSLKSGDCEDFAYLIVDALRYHGYEARILSVEVETNRGLLTHAVGIYRDKELGRWYYINAYNIKELVFGIGGGFGSAPDLAVDVARKMRGELYQYFIMSPETFTWVYDAMIN
jgi:hypothetical protein